MKSNMVIKLCLGTEIHRISKIPENFESLLNYTVNIFKDKLPEVFTFQYPDSDNDLVMLTNETGYLTMLATEDSSKAIKIFIVKPGETMSQSSMFRSTLSRSTLPSYEEPKSNLEQVLKSEELNHGQNQKQPEPEANNDNQSREEISNSRDNDLKNEEEQRQEPVQDQRDKDEDIDDLLKSAKELLQPAQEDIEEIKNRKLDQSAAKIGRFYKKRRQTQIEEKEKEKEKEIKKKELIKKLENRSAVMIQKNFRGYVSRKELIKFAESVVQETSHSNPKRNDLIDHPEEIMKQKSEILYPEKPIIEGIESHYNPLPHSYSNGIYTDISVIKGALREVFLENVETLTKLLKPEPVEIPRAEQVVDHELISLVQDIAKTYKALNPFLQERIDEQFKGSVKKLVKHYSSKYEAEPQKISKPVDNANKLPVQQEEIKIDSSRYDLTYVKEMGTIPKIITIKDPTIYKTVVIKNTGKEEWPKNTILTCVDGLKASECKIPNLATGKEFSAVLNIINPGKPGNHSSTWRARYTDEKGFQSYFGKELKIDLVIEGKKDENGEKTYNDVIVKKANEIKDILGVDEKKACEFVAKYPNLSTSDLLEKYFAS